MAVNKPVGDNARSPNNAKSAVRTGGPAKEFRHAMALSAALGVVCFSVALVAAHFVGH